MLIPACGKGFDPGKAQGSNVVEAPAALSL
jgi:hypothetical protein